MGGYDADSSDDESGPDDDYEYDCDAWWRTDDDTSPPVPADLRQALDQTAGIDEEDEDIIDTGLLLAGIDSSDEEGEDWGGQVVVAEAVSAPGDGITKSELFDSGCSKHLTGYREDLENFREIPPKSLRAANKQSFHALGVGDLVIDVPNGVDTTQLRLVEVLYSPEVGHTLVSVGKLDDCGLEVSFGGGKCWIRDQRGTKIGEIPKTIGGLYRVTHETDAANSASHGISIETLHRRLGHISPRAAKRLVDEGMVTGLAIDPLSNIDFFCEPCVYAKSTRKPVPKVREGERAKKFGEEIHSDVWGPARIETLKGKKYYVTFTDDHTRLTQLHLMRSKDEVFQHYKTFEAFAQTQLDSKIKVLHSDNGGEYTGKEFTLYLKSKGTKQKLTIHNTPQHNGVAERRNRTIIERARAIFMASKLPHKLWGEAVRHIVWLVNRTSTKALKGKTPHEAAFGSKPDFSMVREWGEEVWVRTEKGDKLKGAKAIASVGRRLDIGSRSSGTSRSRTLVLALRGRIWISSRHQLNRPLSFLKTLSPPAEIAPPAPETTQQPPKRRTVTVETEDESDAPQPRPQRVKKPSKRVQDLMDGQGTYSARKTAPTLPPGVPKPTPEPLFDEKEADEAGYAWLKDLEDEIAMLVETADVEALEPRSLAEAKLCADWEQWKAAIEEELKTLRAAGTWRLVEPPAGANIVGSKWVFKAKKDVAGNVVRYKARLVAQGFSQVPGVDYFDMFAPVANIASIRTVLAIAAANDWELHQIDVDLGELHWLLGMEIRRERENRILRISQRSFIDSLTSRYLPSNTKPLSLPLDPNIRLTSDHSPKTTKECAEMAKKPYAELVGSLMFVMTGTRPDIAFPVQTFSRFTKNPGITHWNEVIRCLRYLQGTRDHWLTYGGKEQVLVGYADADGSMAEDRKAISGYAFMINGGAVSWSSKRQNLIALSTTEAEYCAATHAAKEAVWLRSFISKIFDISHMPATTLFSDNQSAIALTKDHRFRARTKHIDIRYHFIRWVVEKESLRLVYCPTEDMVADALTKALPSATVKHFASELGLVKV
ncbi:hypothetical protein ONZ45_g5159 [Pleurotus djamor]|nr:hypothetical protein ONZ45_g5159 [Pleurotus djamor]